MDIFSNDVRYFLNNLDDMIPVLLRKSTSDIIQANVLQDISCMILHNNEFAILNRIGQILVKTLFATPSLVIKSCPFTINKESTDGEYILSDFHMEFDLNEKSLQFIKSIIANKTIHNRGFVFIIKNSDFNVNKNLVFELRRLIDLNSGAKFIITTVETSSLDKSLMSRSILLNCAFPLDHIMKSGLECLQKARLTDIELQQLYIESGSNIITFLQVLETYSNDMRQSHKLLWQQHVDALLQTLKRDKNELNVIKRTRDLVYKLYHLNISLKCIGQYIIRCVIKEHDVNTSDTTKKKRLTKKDIKHIDVMQNIIKCVSDCEHQACLNSKNLLIYEKLFLNIYSAMKS